jgi:hypothetical protein
MNGLFFTHVFSPFLRKAGKIGRFTRHSGFLFEKLPLHIAILALAKDLLHRFLSTTRLINRV